MPPPGTAPETPRTSPVTRTYEDLVNHIHDLGERPTIAVTDVPSPEGARTLAVGRSHDSLTVLASQVRQLQARQAARSDVALELGALHDAIISQTHNYALTNSVTNFASEGVQGLGRFGDRLFNPNTNLGLTNRLIDGGVAIAGVTVAGLALRKFWSIGKGVKGILRLPLSVLKGLLITGTTLGTGWLAMRYVDMRSAADETNVDNPARRGANATALNTRNQALGEILSTDTRTNMRDLELTTLSLPIRTPAAKLLRFAVNGTAVLVRRQTVAPGTAAITESIQMQVESIHTDANGEFVVRQGGKTIYVPAADFYRAVDAAAVGTPMVLGGFNNPRAMTGRAPDSITVNWQATPAVAP